MDEQTAGRVLATVEGHTREISEVRTDLKFEADARAKGDADVHSRINGIYRMGAGQLLGLLIAIVLLVLKK